MPIIHFKRKNIYPDVVEKRSIPKCGDEILIDDVPWVVDNVVFSLPYPHVTVLLVAKGKYDKD